MAMHLMFALLVCLWLPPQGFSFIPVTHRGLNRLSMSTVTESSVEVEFKLITYNILAPCYKRFEKEGETCFEETDKDKYMARNNEIVQELIARDADVIAIQEFWASNAAIRKIFLDRLVEEAGYSIRVLPRTSHWRTRDDGLAFFVKQDRIDVQDYRDILYHDCGDRVAQMFLLGLRPSAYIKDQYYPIQQFLCLNTHLLFPHNEYSTKIRLRETTKLLGYVESYRQKELCFQVIPEAGDEGGDESSGGVTCSRSDVKIPVIVTGDFNGGPTGTCFQFMKAQNYNCAVEDYATSDKSHFDYGTLVTHKSHKQEYINVDHVFYCNPNNQNAENLPAIPDWTNLVFRELMERIIEQYGAVGFREAFSDFDQDNSNYIDKDEFRAALQRLGFGGEGRPTLTEEEIEILLSSADSNNNGKIEYKEFMDRIWMASNNVDFSDVANTALTSSDEDNGNNNENRKENKEVEEVLEREVDESDLDLDNPLLASANSIARSEWLSEDFSARSSEGDDKETTKAVVKNIIFFDGDEAPGKYRTRAEDAVIETRTKLQELPESRPMSDIYVKGVDIYPKQLQTGEWPSEYQLSDHGLVEVTFGCILQNMEY